MLDFMYKLLALFLIITPIFLPAMPSCIFTRVNQLIPTSGTPSFITFSPYSLCLAVSNSKNKSLSLFSITPNGLLNAAHLINLSSEPGQIAFAPLGNLCAVCLTESKTLVTFKKIGCDLSDPLVLSESFPGSPLSLSCSPDGNYVAIGTLDNGNVYLYQIINNTLINLSSAAFAPSTQPQSLAFSPDSNYLVVAEATHGALVCFRSITNGLQDLRITRLPSNASNNKLAVTFSPQGDCLVVSDFIHNTLYVYQFSAGVLTANPTIISLPAGSGPLSLAFSPDGNYVAVANSTSNTLSIFTVSDSMLSEVLGSPFLTGGIGPCSVAFSPDNTLLAVSNAFSQDLSIFTKISVPVITSSSFNTTILTGMGANPGNTLLLQEIPSLTILAQTQADKDGNFTLALNALAPGSYTVRVLSVSPFNKTCFVCTEQFSLSKAPAIKATINPTRIILNIGDTISLHADVQNLPSSSLGAYASDLVDPYFSWTGPDNFSAAGAAINISNITLGKSGVYTLAITENGISHTTTSAQVLVNPIITQPSNSFLDTQACTISGIAHATTLVTLYANSTIIGTALSDTAGNFSFTLPAVLKNGYYQCMVSVVQYGTKLISNKVLVLIDRRKHQSLLSKYISAKYSCLGS